MTVHSTPLTGANKSVATPLGSPTIETSSSSSTPTIITSAMVSTVAQSTNVMQQALAQVTSPIMSVASGDRPPRPVAQIKSIGRVAPQSKSNAVQAKQQPPPRPPRPVAVAEENDKNLAADSTTNQQSASNQPVIRARPLTIRKQPACEQPKLRKPTSQVCPCIFLHTI